MAHWFSALHPLERGPPLLEWAPVYWLQAQLLQSEGRLKDVFFTIGSALLVEIWCPLLALPHRPSSGRGRDRLNPQQLFPGFCSILHPKPCTT